MLIVILLARTPATRSSRNPGAHHDYVPTSKGKERSIVLVALSAWGGSHAFAANEAAPVVVDRRDRKPVRVVALAEDGRVLGPGDTMLVVPERAA